jgi:RHS repeat-associated protein
VQGRPRTRTKYTYDSAGRLWKVKDPNNKTETFGYDSANRMTTVTDKRGNLVTTNVYDANGRVSQQTLADGALWQFSYALDGLGNVSQTTVTDPRGTIRQDTFNADGYLTQEVRALGLPEQQTLTIERDAANVVLSVTDALGRKTRLSRDGFNNITGVTRLADTANAVTDSFSYENTYQQLAGYTDPLGHSTTLGHDWLGNLTSVKDALGHTVQVTNDPLGRPSAITNALGKVTHIAYNLGDPSSVMDPLGRSTFVFTDAAGRTTGAANPLGQTTRVDYDPLDRPLHMTNALGGQTVLTYDENGNVLTVQDPRAAGTHLFAYDGRNRVHMYTDPLGATETYNYDGMGNLTSKLDRKGQTTSYAYDGLNRLHAITFADSSTITITWDAGNRPTQFADSINGSITRQYDGLDRLTEEVSPQGQLDYQYDTAGRRTQMTVSGLSPVTYQYDNANRLTQIAQGATVVGLGYDAASRRTGVTLPNGIVGTATYDDADQLTALSYDRSGTHIGDLAYGYDQAGRRTGQSGSLASLGLPASVSSASYDAANRLTNWGGAAVTYDSNGNMSALGASTYNWNVRDQLTATSDGSGQFAYDALGRRVNRTIAGFSIPYLYDGDNAATVSGNQILAGHGIDELYAQVGVSSTRSYLLDALGSTLALTDSGGSVTSSYSYGAYGTTTPNGAAETTFAYTGRENDGATSLYYYRARYYNAAMGRFISEDPLGLMGGINVYAYTGGNPTSLTDPLGLLALPSLPQSPRANVR